MRFLGDLMFIDRCSSFLLIFVCVCVFGVIVVWVMVVGCVIRFLILFSDLVRVK